MQWKDEKHWQNEHYNMCNLFYFSMKSVVAQGRKPIKVFLGPKEWGAINFMYEKAYPSQGPTIKKLTFEGIPAHRMSLPGVAISTV